VARRKKELTRDDYWERLLLSQPELIAVSEREKEFRDLKPKVFKTKIALVDYFERIKRHRADRWQKDLCDRLQTAMENRHDSRWWAVIHAEGQLGKTSIISQCFPAWVLGHDPVFRYALAMYNVSRSQTHSSVVIQIMRTALHKDIFPDKDGWLSEDPDANFGRNVSKAGWMTRARRELNDGQLSFNPVGLQSGLTGSGFDWLSIDDPYKEAKEAFSEQINLGMQNFYDYTVQSRVGLHSCVSGMFHRYAPEDFAGFLLDTGDFEYLRYATQADGDYIHESTGKRYPDPLGRRPGQYISPSRRPKAYYEKPRKNNRVWLSMFQGRPSSEEGDFFNVSKISYIAEELAADRRREVIAIVRSYDVASTEEAGAFSVGAKVGMRPDGKATVFDVWRERVDTAARLRQQKQLAKEDGTDVTITVPIDPGAAGQTVVWFTEQHLHGNTVVGMPTSGSKEQRAMNLSAAVNSGEIEFVVADWNTAVKRELRDFPLSEYKDCVDALSDAYNHLFEVVRRGTVIKNYRPQRNLVPVSEFIARFPVAGGEPVLKIPQNWAIYVGVKISGEASEATSAVVAARASVNSNLPETLFVLDEYKAYDADMYRLFDWITKRLGELSDRPDATVWLHPDSEQYLATITQKLDFPVVKFTDDELAGHNELNWYLLPTELAHPFGASEHAAHLYFLVDDRHLTVADADQPSGFYHARQEIATWGFSSDGKPTKIGQVVDCLRMITHRFKTYSEPVTFEEDYQAAIKKHFPNELVPGEMTMQRQQELEAAKLFAKLDMMELHGPDVFERERQTRERQFQTELEYAAKQQRAKMGLPEIDDDLWFIRD
jgi:predicted phage terminase large subunit-like protein